MVKLEDFKNLSTEELIDISNELSNDEWVKLIEEFNNARKGMGLSLMINGMKFFVTYEPKNEAEIKTLLKNVADVRNLSNNLDTESEEYKEIIALCNEIENRFK